MGIRSLQRVRAATMNDLIYKNGHTGITKASVTLVLDNSDHCSALPQEYRMQDRIHIAREISVGGRNRYLINGRSVQANEIQAIFSSVGVNVNNPHFLILQGTVMKVVNSKPHELLGMIEEASGTRLYDQERSAAMKQLTKKQVKVDAIEQLIQEKTRDMEPLMKDREELKRYELLVSKASELEQKLVKHDYAEMTHAISMGASAKIEGYRLDEEHALVAKREEIKSSMKELRSESSESRKAELQAEVAMAEECLANAQRELSSIGGRLKDMQSQRLKLTGGKKDTGPSAGSGRRGHSVDPDDPDQLEQLLEKLDRDHHPLKTAHDDLKANLQILAKAKLAAENELAGVSAGSFDVLDESSGAEIPIADAISAARKSVSSLQGELKKLRMKQTKEAGNKKNGTGTDDVSMEGEVSAIDGIRRERDELSAQIRKLQDSISGSGDGRDDESTQAELSRKVEGLYEAQSSMKGQVQAHELSLPASLSSLVIGVMAKLVRLRPKYATSGDRELVQQLTLALEVAGGAKWRSVAVKDKRAAVALVRSGCLRRKTTLLPLDFLDAPPMPSNVEGALCDAETDSMSATQIQDQAAGQGISAGQGKSGQSSRSSHSFPRAILASKLLEFDPQLDVAVRHVLGRTFICRDAEAAKAIVYGRVRGLRCVTLAGDMYTSTGTLTGGRPSWGSPGRSGALGDFFAYGAIEAQIRSINERLVQISLRVKSRSEGKILARRTEHHISVLQARVADMDRLINQRTQGTGVDAGDVDMTGNNSGSDHSVQSLDNQIAAAESKLSTSQAKVLALEKQKADFERDYTLVVRTAKRKAEEAKAAHAKALEQERHAAKKLTDADSKRIEIQDKISVAKQVMEAQQSDLASVEAQIKDLEAAKEKLLTKVSGSLQPDIDKAIRKQDEARNQDSEIQEALANLQSQLETVEAEARQIALERSGLHKASAVARDKLATLLSKHTWLREWVAQVEKAAPSAHDEKAAPSAQDEKVAPSAQDEKAAPSAHDEQRADQAENRTAIEVSMAPNTAHADGPKRRRKDKQDSNHAEDVDMVQGDRSGRSRKSDKSDMSGKFSAFLLDHADRVRVDYDNLTKQLASLSKSVNRKAGSIVDKIQTALQEAKAKLEKTLKKKKTIERTIETLDVEKYTLLNKVWRQVSDNLSGIFSSLLPDVDAKLVAGGKGGTSDVLDGLDLRVKLGKHWKESLTELSGGQKSLLALSLILAILKYKPAPFYILDEIDAALDLSHTQNIGKMIKHHFPGAQFIVVSLKEGMFNNANSLFKVRFDDGRSIVSRLRHTEPQSAHSSHEAVDSHEDVTGKENNGSQSSKHSRKAARTDYTHTGEDLPV